MKDNIRLYQNFDIALPPRILEPSNPYYHQPILLEMIGNVIRGNLFVARQIYY